MSNHTFPVIQSTLSPIHLATWITEQYGLTDVSCRVLKTNMNHSYRVAAGNEDYILRIYDHTYRTRQQAEEEVLLLNKIKDIVSASYPIGDVHNQYINEIPAPEGTRCAVLFSFAQGKKVRNLTTDLNSRIGTEVGRFHKSTQNTTTKRTDYSISILIDWAHDQLANHIPVELEEMQFIKNMSGVLSQAFDKSLTKGIVHLDIWYDNMAIEEDGTITLFDFDNCGNGWLVLDLGYYCMQLFYTEPDLTEYERKKKAFIDSYRSLMPLPDEELPLIPYAGMAIWIYYMGVQAQRFDTFGNFFLSANYVKMMIARVKGWLKYNKVEMLAD
jgi:Ser/Thr protein kinase RdoA (MazF antagonist)